MAALHRHGDRGRARIDHRPAGPELFRHLAFSLRHRAPGGPTPTQPAPHGIPYQGFPRILCGRETVLFRWYQVPYSYIDRTDSFIRYFQGYVNQYDWLGH